VVKYGRFGKFIACSGYPDCKTTKPFLVKVGVKCPKCGGELVVKKSKKKRTFYGCSNYPECNFIVNTKPLPQPCPQCGGLLTAYGRNIAKCTQCEFKGKLGDAKETEIEPEKAKTPARRAGRKKKTS